MHFLKCLIVVAVMALPATVLAAGAHEDLSCVGCHGIHTAKDGKLIFAVSPNTKDINPATGKAYAGVTALCLGCHQSSENGGDDIMPVSGHMSHPFGMSQINPKVAAVPDEVLRDGSFECVACHDPHPSNPNYRYLRVSTGGGANMSQFCSVCHSVKADPKNINTQELFNSMDQTQAAN